MARRFQPQLDRFKDSGSVVENAAFVAGVERRFGSLVDRRSGRRENRKKKPEFQRHQLQLQLLQKHRHHPRPQRKLKESRHQTQPI